VLFPRSNYGSSSMNAFPPPELQYKLTLVKLQQHRLTRLALWRACCIIFCTTGLGLATVLPNSQIKTQNQININGDTLVDKNTVYQALKLTYPQFIWSVNGIEITQKIEAIPSIEAAKVNKQIIPPLITISLQEKAPVALATAQGEVGFLNTQGEWIAQKFYSGTKANFQLPKLKVIDYQLRFQSTWQKIYQLILLYPELKVSEVHWQTSGDIFLETKIGRVFLGSESSRLEQQFKTISKLKNLPKQLKTSEIAYIDLSNPGVNLIQKY
jgi:cell division protein FtsQ